MSTPTTEWGRRLRAALRVATRTGVAFDLRPRGVAALVRARVAGPLGLAAIARVHASARGDALAIVDGEVRRTWRELDQRIDRLANGLAHEHGLARGDAAVLMMQNRAEFIEAQAALARLGGSAVSVSWRSTADELAYLVSHCGARAVIVDRDRAASVDAARERLTGVPTSNFVVVGGAHEGYAAYEPLLRRSAPSRRYASEGAVVIYTSGTTGKPKGAVRTFPKEMAWAVIDVLDALPLRVDDRHLAVCPMYHSTAFGFIGFTLTLGGTVHIAREFDPEAFLRAIDRERITTTAVVPTMLHRVLALPARVRARYDTSSLRAILSGGAPLSGELARRTIEAFGHVLFNFYGSTETGLNTIAGPEDLLRAPGTIGRAIGGNHIRLLDERGRDVPDGETGEVFVRNAMLVAGYHRDEEATRGSMREGFFSVGDLAHRDADGLFHLDGRKRDMIISGGVNVYPAEVEEILARHPHVAEAAVVGIADEEWGERVRAFVVARDGDVDLGDLAAFARAHLATTKIPREYVVLDQLPKNPTGKVLKRELKARG